MTTRKNDSFEKVAEVLRAAESVFLYPHVSMDGDAMGSAVAMCRVLRQMGKTCHVVIEDDIPDNLQFMENGYMVLWEDVTMTPDISMCVDCGEDSRYPKRAEMFHRAPISICLDHHPTTAPVFDYNIIDPEAAATAELVYQLTGALGQEIDKETGEALYAAITTDTGNFQYSNTTAWTHRIVADLFDSGINANYVSVMLYETQRPERLLIESRIFSGIRFYADGKLAIATVTRKMMQECDARAGETDNVVAILRSIRGVEIAAFLKEKEQDLIRVSLRAKGSCDVAAIASAFDGGGHRKAAGATLHMSLEEAVDRIREKAMESLAENEEIL